MTTTTLATRIAAASKDVGGKLKTDKTNTQQNYSYISADKILSVCGQALAEEGVVVFPSVTNDDTHKEEGGKRYDARVTLVFTISDGTNGIEMPWVGYGSDYAVPDKAIYKAITSGHKYFLMKLLNIGAGNEDGEHEEEQPKPAARPQQRSPLASEKVVVVPPANGNGHPEVVFDSAAAARRMPDFQKKMAELHHQGGPASDGQYTWLSGEIDKITQKDAHRSVLEFLIERPVAASNPPSSAVARQLLDWLPTNLTKKDGGGPKPKHRSDVVEIIKYIWSNLQEQVEEESPFEEAI
jgi:hypothetical protein